jgi:uncharacterized protein (TIGR03435 family)
MKRSLMVLVVMTAVFSGPSKSLVLAAQSQAVTAARPSFEVASIKPNNSQSGSSSSGYRPGGLYIATNVSLKSLIMESYRIHDFQLLGGPNWLATDRFDVQARAEAGAIADVAEPFDPTRPTRLLLMVQSMLEDRFRLKIRRETRELPLYVLVIGSGGPKMTAAAGDKNEGIGTNCCKDGIAELNAKGVPMTHFAATLSQQLGRVVVDKTGLKGSFDIKLRWTPDQVTLNTRDVSGPSIFAAVQEQLGLRLESAKGPVDVIVVESAEKPAEN